MASDKQNARRELLSILALATPAVKKQADNAPLELGDLNLETVYNLLVSAQEYLQGEIALEETRDGRCRTCGASVNTRPAEGKQTDIDQWLATETSRLVSNTAAAYRMPQVDAIQRVVYHLVAGAVLTGAALGVDEYESEIRLEKEKKRRQ